MFFILSKVWNSKLMFYMKLTFVIWLCVIQSFAISSFSQNVRLSINQNNVTLRSVLQLIEDQTDYYFMYIRDNIDVDRKMDVHVESKQISEILNNILEGTDISFKIRGRLIALSRGTESGVSEQPVKITGMVKDAEGQPLPGATVIIKGSANGTITNAAGKYMLSRVPSDAVLVFSFVGMRTVEIPVSGKTVIDMVLEEETIGIEEVIAIGYGGVKKGDMTGSVGVLRGETLAKAPVASFTEALAGRVAGVRASSTDGQPGSELNIVIRGAGSLTQNTAPLYVIDGFPLENPDLSSINPEEIESMSILKDASSTAIYGARGANGVVVIETKKGKIGVPVITVNSSFGFQQVQKTIDVMSPYEFVKYQSELNPAFVEDNYFQNDRTLDYYKDVDGVNWQDEIFRDSPIIQNNISIRGGTTQTKYSISGSIYNMEGIVINTGFDRYQGRITLDQTIGKKIRVGITANYSKKNTRGQQVADGTVEKATFTSYLLSRAWGYRPVSGKDNFNLLEEESDPDLIDQHNVRLNPVTTSENDYTRDYTKTLTANTYLQYKILKNLTLKVTGSITNVGLRSERFYNSKTPQGNLLNLFNTRKINGSVKYTDKEVWANENTLTYNKTFGKHQLTMLGGFSMTESKSDIYGLYVQDIPNEELGMRGLDEGVPYKVDATNNKNGMVSYFGRTNYVYDSRYLLTVTFRADASSRLAAGKKWGYFPSAAFAWNMQNEQFMKDNFSPVSNSKFRVSYGITGNDRIGDFDTFSKLSMSNISHSYSFNNETPERGMVPGNLANKLLKWESTEQLNVGYDFGIFKNRIEMTVDYYRKVTKDLLLNSDISAISGFTKMYQNIGKIRNNGWEFTLNTRNISGKGLTWDSSFNISFNRNKVLSLVEGQENLLNIVTFDPSWNSALYISQVGQPAGMFYGYVFDGVYQFDDFENPGGDIYILKNSLPTNGNTRESIQPGDVKYKDINGDGTVNAYDQVVIGRGQPIHTGGFANNVTYKGLSLTVLFEWSYGNQIFNANRLMSEGNGNSRTDLNQYASYVNRWTPENPSNKYFRTGGQGPYGYYSSRVLEDGSYIRLKTLSLGYYIPAKYIKRIYLQKLGFNISAQNLLTFTNYSGMDPEVSVRNSILTPGFDFSAYPIPRTIVLGINATF